MKHPEVVGFALYSDEIQAYLYIDRSDPLDDVGRFTRDPFKAHLWTNDSMARNYLMFAEEHWPADLRAVHLSFVAERTDV